MGVLATGIHLNAVVHVMFTGRMCLATVSMVMDKHAAEFVNFGGPFWDHTPPVHIPEDVN